MGDRILEGSVTMSSDSGEYNIYDDGQGNLYDQNIISCISNSVSFVTHSKDDFHIKIDFNDGWKFQKGNYISDKTFFAPKDLHLEDISNGPYEPFGKNISFGYNSTLSNATRNGVSGSSYLILHGSQSLQTGSNSFVEILNSGELNQNRKEWNDDFFVAMWVNIPVSQSVTQSYTGAFVSNSDTDSNYQRRLLKDHNSNVIATSRKYSKKIHWELYLRNRRTSKKGQ